MEWNNYTKIYRNFEDITKRFEKLYSLSVEILIKLETDAKSYDLFKEVLKTEYSSKFNRLHLFMLGQEFVIIPSMNYPHFYTGHLKCFMVNDSIKNSEIENSQPLLDIEFNENLTINHEYALREFSEQYFLNIYDEFIKIKIANGADNKFELNLRKFTA